MEFFTRVPQALSYKIATLFYCFDEQERVLLMERTRETNIGLWSPCGGILDTASGESPYACACREADEEIGLRVTRKDLHLFGIVRLRVYLGMAHWLMFLFEVKLRLRDLHKAHAEGRFELFRREDLTHLKMPSTDVEQIWPLVWKHRDGFFAAHCRAKAGGANEWVIEEAVGGND